MTPVISYRRRIESDATAETRVNLNSLYHQLYCFMQKLHQEDSFNHEDLLKVAAAMNVIKVAQEAK